MLRTLRRMIMLSIVGAMCAAVTACSTLSYETADGTKVKYTRLFTTSDSLKAKVGEAKVDIGGQKIDNETLNAILRLLGVAVTP